MRVALCCLLGLIHLSWAQGQPTFADSAEANPLADVVISASRWPEPASDVPQQIVRIRPKQIQFFQPQTAADALLQTGQVFVQKSQQGGGSPMLRGFTANGILLVLDGIRMNNAIFRGGNLQNSILVDPNLLAGIEVLHGAGSVQYGSDALGGVIHFSTTTPDYADRFRLRGAAFVRYATANEERAGHLSLQWSAPRWRAFLGVSVTDFGDLRMGRWRTPADSTFGLRRTYVVTDNGVDRIAHNPNPHIQIGSGYTQANGLLKLGYRLSSRTDVLFSAYLTTTGNVPRYDRLNPPSGAMTFAEWYYGPQQWQLHSLQLHLRDHRWYDEARLTLAYQDYRESRHDRRRGNPNRRDQVEALAIYTLNADFRRKLTERHEVYYGLEAWHNEVRSTAQRVNFRTGEASPAATRYPDGGSDVSSVAAYAQYVGKLHRTLTLVAGGRGTWYRLESRFRDRSFFPFPFTTATLETSSWNGNLGLVAIPIQGLRLTGNLSTGFRAPNVDDVGKVFESVPATATEPGILVVPNPNLRPERTTTVESTVDLQHGILRMGATLYHTWLRDALERRPFVLDGQPEVDFGDGPSQVQAIQNVRSAAIWGISGEGELDLGSGFRLHSSLTYTRGRTAEGVPLVAVPPLFGRTSLRVSHRWLQADLNAQYHGWKRLEDMDPNDRANSVQAGLGTPSWWTLNLYTRSRLPWGLLLTLAVENLVDRHYRPYESGISAPGRNWIVALRKAW